MINLLPHEDIRQLRAARTNVLLLRYSILLVGTLVFLAAAIGITYLQLVSAKDIAETKIADNTTRSASFAPVENQAKSFRANLTTAKQILDKEVTYTNVVLAIAKVLPSGVILDTLNLDAKTFGTPITLTAHAKDFSSALSLKTTFQTSNLFSDVHFVSIANDTSTVPGYPVTVNINVTIVKEKTK